MTSNGVNIALLGHGNMGTEIERLVNEAGVHRIVSIGAQKAGEKVDVAALKDAEVVIDFTAPDVALENIKTVVSAGKNMVVGTTGWYEHLPDVEKLVKKSGIGLVYGQNFSVGANIFFRLVGEATRLSAALGKYDVYGFEIHHSGKKDSPSGTALRTAQEILKNSSIKKILQTGRMDRQIKPEELQFASVRGGRHPGFHQVVFDSAADSITISHSAHNRRGFAEGAIMAAEFIRGKKGLYTFDDVINSRKIV